MRQACPAPFLCLSITLRPSLSPSRLCAHGSDWRRAAAKGRRHAPPPPFPPIHWPHTLARMPLYAYILIPRAGSEARPQQRPSVRAGGLSRHMDPLGPLGLCGLRLAVSVLSKAAFYLHGLLLPPVFRGLHPPSFSPHTSPHAHSPDALPLPGNRPPSFPPQVAQ